MQSKTRVATRVAVQYKLDRKGFLAKTQFSQIWPDTRATDECQSEPDCLVTGNTKVNQTINIGGFTRGTMLMAILVCLLAWPLVSVAEESQPVVDSVNNRGSAGGSISSEKKMIPNWSDDLASGKNIKSSGGTPDSVFWGSAGPLSLNGNRALDFKENPEKPGFPVGWNTNSETAILKARPDGGRFIELGESQKPLQLSQIIEIRGERPKDIRLNYSSSTQSRLRIFIFNPQNALTAGIVEEELLPGNDQDHIVTLSIPENASRLLIVIEKESQGTFALTGMSLGKGDGNEN